MSLKDCSKNRMDTWTAKALPSESSQSDGGGSHMTWSHESLQHKPTAQEHREGYLLDLGVQESSLGTGGK